MAVVTRAYSEVDGNIAEASSINKVIDVLYLLQNGNIDDSNISDQGIKHRNLDADVILSGEVYT